MASVAVVHDDSESVIVELLINIRGTGTGTPSLTVTADGQEFYDSTANPKVWKTYSVSSGNITASGSTWLTTPVILKMHKGLPLDTPATLKVTGQNIAEYKIAISGQDEKYLSFASAREKSYATDPNAAPYIPIGRKLIYWGATAAQMGYTPDILPHIYYFYFKRDGDTQDNAGKIGSVMSGWLNAKIALGRGKTGKSVGHLSFVKGTDLKFVSESWDTASITYTVLGLLHSQVITPSMVFDAYFDPNATDPELNITGGYVVRGYDVKTKPGTWSTDHFDYSVYSSPTVAYTVGYGQNAANNTSQTKVARTEGQITMTGYAYQNFGTTPGIYGFWCPPESCIVVPGWPQMGIPGFQNCIQLPCFTVVNRTPQSDFNTYVYDFANALTGDRNCRASDAHTTYDPFTGKPTARTVSSSVGIGSLGLFTQTRVDSARFESLATPIAFGPSAGGQEYFWNSYTLRMDSANASQGGTLVGSANYYNGTGGGADEKLQKQAFADGSWEYYEYYDTLESRGLLKRVTRPSSTGPSSAAAAPVSSVVTDYNYTADYDQSQSLPLSIVTRQIVNNGASDKVLGWIEYDYSASQFENVSSPAQFQGLFLRIERRREHTGGSTTDYLETWSKTFREDTDTLFSGLPLSAVHADGTMDLWNYEMGTYDEPNRQFVPIADSLAHRSVALSYGAVLNGNDGNFYNAQEYRVWKIHGLNNAALGAQLQTYGASSVTFTDPACNCTKTASASTESIYLVPGSSTAEVTTRDRYGRVRLVEAYVYVQTNPGSSSAAYGWVAADRESHDYEEGGNLVKSVKQLLGDTGIPWYTVYEAVYTDVNAAQYTYSSVSFNNAVGNRTGRKEYERDRSGTISKFIYDSYGRVSKIVTLAPPAMAGLTSPPEIQTRLTYDADCRVLSTGVGPRTAGDTDDLQALLTSRVYNLAGLVLSETAPGGYTTLAVYSRANAGLTSTKTLPNGQTEITAHYLNGQLQSVSGTALVPAFYSYSISGGASVTVNGTTRTMGALQAIHSQGSSTAATTSKLTTSVDWVGRHTTETESNPSSVGDLTTSFSYYADKLWRTQQGSFAPKLREYDPFGQIANIGIKLDTTTPNQLIGPSMDRISSQVSYFAYDQFGLKEVSAHVVYPNDNDATYTQLGSTVKYRWARLVNLVMPGNGTFPCLMASYTQVFDFNNSSTTKYNLAARDRAFTLSQDVNSYSSVPANRGFLNNRLVYQLTSSEVREDFFYDTSGRITTTRSRAGDTATVYKPGTTQILWAKSEDNIWTEFTYDSGARLISKKQYTTKSATQPLSNGIGMFTRFSYNNRNQVRFVWGDVSYPLENVYYESGGATGYAVELEGMLYEKRTYNSTSAGWSGTIWPTSPGTPNRTRYTYYPESGLLKEVMYDTTGAGTSFQKTTYEYNKVRELTKRTWNRTFGSNPIFTQYAYSPTTAELTDILHTDASDPTPPNISNIQYTRLGALKSLKDPADAVNGRMFWYKPNDLQLSYETLPTGTYGPGVQLLQTYDPAGRPNGWTLNRGGASDNYIAYGFDSFNSRLYSIGTPLGSFRYDYLANSDLVSGMDAFLSSMLFHHGRSFAPDSDLVQTWTTSVGTVPIAVYSLIYDDRDRLQKYSEVGSIYDPYGSGLSLNLGYNDRNELTAATSYLTSNLGAIPNPSLALPRRGYTYAFDSIGNRTGTTIDLDPSLNYSPNVLGQYATRGRPNFVEISGFSGKSTTLTASRAGAAFPVSTVTSTDPQYNFFYGKGTRPANSSTAQESVVTTASLTGATSATASRNLLVPATAANGASTETFTYDTDGNTTGDSFWIYRYDAENRIRQIESMAGLPTMRVTFTYDFLGRRVKKVIENKPGASWVPTSVRVFAYDGSHVIAEYESITGSLSLQTTYSWGLDVSGSVHGSAGIGGLLGLQLIAGGYQSLLAVSDPHGNVVGLVDGSNGSLQAAYEYNAFGEQIRASGAKAAKNPFRFSTKFYDAETDLLCFGHRFYSSSLGRFISRDPIAEPGRFLIASVFNGGDISVWSYVNDMLATPGKSARLTPDTSLARAGLGFSTDSTAGSLKNSTLPGNVVATEKSNGGGHGGYISSLFTPYVGPQIDGGSHLYAYVQNAAYASHDPLGLGLLSWIFGEGWSGDAADAFEDSMRNSSIETGREWAAGARVLRDDRLFKENGLFGRESYLVNDMSDRYANLMVQYGTTQTYVIAANDLTGGTALGEGAFGVSLDTGEFLTAEERTQRILMGGGAMVLSVAGGTQTLSSMRAGYAGTGLQFLDHAFSAISSEGASEVDGAAAAAGTEAESQIPTIGGRQPINSKYAGSAHPAGVDFTEQGFPDFSPHSIADVEMDGLTGNYSKDSAMANRAAGLDGTPDGYVWHHVEDGRTMQLLPQDIHNAVRHTGGAAVIRNGGFDFGRP